MKADKPTLKCVMQDLFRSITNNTDNNDEIFKKSNLIGMLI